MLENPVERVQSYQVTEGKEGMLPLWLLIAYTCWGSCCVILYMVIVIQLIRYRNVKPFNSSFFSLVIVTGFADVLQHISFVFECRVPLCTTFGPWYMSLADTNLFLKVVVVGNFGIRFFRNLMSVFTSFNRATAALLPNLHDKIWKFIYYPLHALAIGISLSLTWQLILGVAQCRIIYGYPDAVLIYPLYNNASTKTTAKNVYFAIPVTAINVIINAATIASLFYRASGSKQKGYRHMGLNLFFIAFVDFVIMVLITVIECIVMFYKCGGLCDNIFLHMQWMNDLHSFSRPFTLILTSKAVRQLLKSTVYTPSQSTVGARSVTIQPMNTGKRSVRSH